MGDSRLCTACGATLLGPCEPAVAVSYVPPAQEEENGPVKLTVRCWICPGCGLAHWYAGEQDLARLQQVEEVEGLEGIQSGSGYERRAQMQRMLRKVRRI